MKALEKEVESLQRKIVSHEMVIQELCGIGVQWKRTQPSGDDDREKVSVEVGENLDLLF